MVGKRLIKKRKSINTERLDKVVQQARACISERDMGYREQSLKIHPWVCARCGKEFTRDNLHLLTVHHIDHNHDNNPPDGSNWENLCIYCHDREHQKLRDFEQYGNTGLSETATVHMDEEQPVNNPFAVLKDKL